MSLILNIESSTEVCSVAISEGEKVLALKEIIDQRAHAKVITLLINEAIKGAKTSLKDLDAIAISAGPGSYTALRVGTSVAKGIGYALDKPLIAIDTLQAIAWATLQQEKQEAIYVPMIDARRMDVYAGMYDQQNYPVTENSFKSIDKNTYISYFATEKKIIFSGNGAEKCRDIISSSLAQFSSVVCSAANMPYLSHQSYQKQAFVDLAYFVPNYLKAPNITTSKRNPLKVK